MHDPALIRWLAPAAALVAGPACATTYLTLEQAQQKLFPGQTLEELAIELDAGQWRAVEEQAGTRPRERRLRVWKSADGGYFYLDRVIGKHELITYALALDADGRVKGLEILDYRESYGGQVRNPKWRGQFVGKRHGDAVELDVDIVNLSGATLSCRHITQGVRRLLAAHAIAVAGQ